MCNLIFSSRCKGYLFEGCLLLDHLACQFEKALEIVISLFSIGLGEFMVGNEASKN